MTKTIFLLFSVLGTLPAWAEVDVREASAKESFVDDLGISRHYDSRSDRIGLFGYGWCSDLEAKLEALPGERFRIYECGKATEWSYFRRALYASRDAWIGESDPTDQLVRDEKQIRRLTARRQTQVFSQNGKLLETSERNGVLRRIGYSSRDRIEGFTEGDDKIKFEHDPKSEFIIRASGPDAKVVLYRYRDLDLISVVQNDGRRWDYQFDDLHNLRSAKANGTLLFENEFDRERDRVTSRRTKGGCREDFIYHDDERGNVSTFTTQIARHCPGKKTQLAKFTFRYVARGTPSRVLTQMSVENQKGAALIHFDAETGRTLQIDQQAQRAPALR